MFLSFAPTPRSACSVDYVLTVSQLGDDSVTIELEQEFNSQRWRGDFSAECEWLEMPSALFQKAPLVFQPTRSLSSLWRLCQ